MLALLLATAIANAPCADPSITSATVRSVSTDGGLNHYTIAVTVENQGTLRQPSNLLQSVDVIMHGERVDRMGLQPLWPQKSQTVTYAFDRSVEAGDGSTALTFALDLNGRTGSDVDCHAGEESVLLNV